MKPAINRLAHTRAINEARIFVEQTPKTEWISERVLKPGYPKGAKIPDGVVRISGEHHAVEVELTAKSEARLRRTLPNTAPAMTPSSISAPRRSWACWRGSAKRGRTRNSSFEPCPIGRPLRPNRRRRRPPCIRGEESQDGTTSRSLT